MGDRRISTFAEALIRLRRRAGLAAASPCGWYSASQLSCAQCTYHMGAWAQRTVELTANMQRSPHMVRSGLLVARCFAKPTCGDWHQGRVWELGLGHELRRTKRGLDGSDALLQRVVLGRQRVHLRLQLAAVLLPQRDLRDGMPSAVGRVFSQVKHEMRMDT